MILLVESGLVFLVIQVGCFGIVLTGNILKFLTFLTGGVVIDLCVWDRDWWLFVRSEWLWFSVFFSCRKCCLD